MERFDHHCPILGNCVGAGNHRTFVCFLAAMVLAQLLFCQLLSGLLLQNYTAAAATTAAAAAAMGPGSSAGSTSALAGILSSGSSSSAAGQVAVGHVAAANAATPGALSSSSGSGSNLLSGAMQGRVAEAAGWGLQGWWQLLQALWAAADSHTGLLLLLLAQVRCCIESCPDNCKCWQQELFSFQMYSNAITVCSA